MNFVIFSFNFLPANDAESYCTARFASALARCGHSVHVVTMEHPQRVSNETCRFLLDPRVQVTRVTFRHRRYPYLSRLRYLTNEYGSENFAACIQNVRRILQSVEKPILISRANPNSSMIIGWHCHKWAWKWIAHASDPIPIPGRYLNSWTRRGFEYRYWVRRAFLDANYFSVTCPNAIRAYQDEYGSLTQQVKFVVTPHIGCPPLPQEHCSVVPALGKVILHQGVLCQGRGGEELARVISVLRNAGIDCFFVQVGPLEGRIDFLGQNGSIRLESAPQSQVVFIPDLQVPLPYCPFLSSKIVYQLFYDKPILLYTHRDSISAQLAKDYPEAGIFFADTQVQDSLLKAARIALNCDPAKIDRRRIRDLFTEENVVRNFIRGIGL